MIEMQARRAGGGGAGGQARGIWHNFNLASRLQTVLQYYY